MTKQITFTIGARGLQHKGWQGSFYPDDMPEEWRLEFYAHEFHSLLLPTTEFPDAATWQEWRDIPDERFNLFIELPEGCPDDMLLMLKSERMVKGLIKQGASEFATGGVLSRDMEQDLPGIKDNPAITRLIYIVKHAAGQPLDLKAWKERLLALVDVLPDEAALDIIIEGEPPSIEAMRQLVILVELMGW